MKQMRRWLALFLLLLLVPIGAGAAPLSASEVLDGLRAADCLPQGDFAEWLTSADVEAAVGECLSSEMFDGGRICVFDSEKACADAAAQLAQLGSCAAVQAGTALAILPVGADTAAFAETLETLTGKSAAVTAQAAEPEADAPRVWIPTHGGKKYHSKKTCSGMIDPKQVTVSEAEKKGFTPCKKCFGK